ncbi:hypothetical protein PILCRDRAFT_623449 [Piloderma croceum F 1598]|uniref:Transcription factor domain-containing protein n=1 Tax=Piloderma croceum (strain F 1598) TaxID=765440 RepID=A0A0C3BJ01_PILCF|nr:hypothetical protein PILCRDRAFT_623449 [Piloderma croceum F 1598]
MFSIVSKEYLVGELIPAVYYPNRMHSMRCSSHDLALLLTVLAIGLLVDFDLGLEIEVAQLYIRLAWSTALLPALPTIATVKCLHLMNIYHGMAGDKYDSHRLLISAWQCLHYIKLHEDPDIKAIKNEEAYDRRAYFWNLLQPILWQSLMTGILPSVLETPHECYVLSEQDEKDYDKREAVGFGAWSSKFTYQCLRPVTIAVIDPNPPDYKHILALDERIRTFPIPSSSPNSSDLPSIMQHFIYSHYREHVLMFLHRDSFKQTLTDNPMDPLTSTRGYSFTTTYESACVVLDSTINLYAKAKYHVPKIWRIWANAFCATVDDVLRRRRIVAHHIFGNCFQVVIGAVAVLTPNVKLEPCPLRKLEDACALFEVKASCASSALPKVLETFDSALRSAGQVVPMRHVTHLTADLQGDNIVFEDTWSVRLYEEVMQAAQAHISD